MWLLRVVLCVSLQAAEQGRPPEHTSKFYAKGALQYLVPILTQTLTKQVSCKMPAVYPEVGGGKPSKIKAPLCSVPRCGTAVLLLHITAVTNTFVFMISGGVCILLCIPRESNQHSVCIVGDSVSGIPELCIPSSEVSVYLVGAERLHWGRVCALFHSLIQMNGVTCYSRSS